MITRKLFARALTMLVLTCGVAACGVDGTEPSEFDAVDVTEEAQSAAMGPEEEVVAADPEQSVSTTETNAGGCLTYVGVITVKEYECPCWFTYYYDRFYNVCSGTYSDTYLYAKSSCNTKYGYICP